ncbi:LysR substrate-binding domain-containing protein [Cypionkella psychrotolerans]|uniref:LysR substrate-binding domain-containing protein n=1 Tax=Cypionkella psychrotolerans TaxID=1678131 RepID=UPI001F3223F5|nr:LysR substrate-binding domain-containing protein [Cypionkella psychrotolerans]
MPFLSFDDDCFYRQWALDIGQDDGAMMETVFECSSAAGIMAAVNAGLGVALLSDRYLRPDMEVVRDRLPVLLCLPMSSAGRANQEIRRWIA